MSSLCSGLDAYSQDFCSCLWPRLMFMLLAKTFVCLQPRLLDDYSDPIDVKKDIKENHKLLGRLASLARHNQSVDLQDTSDDDYSVPYEIKKLNRGNLNPFRLKYPVML